MVLPAEQQRRQRLLIPALHFVCGFSNGLPDVAKHRARRAGGALRRAALRAMAVQAGHGVPDRLGPHWRPPAHPVPARLPLRAGCRQPVHWAAGRARAERGGARRAALREHRGA
eukprot:scaffold10017_cov54-Phaeocystis_antarctica.AAC.3